MAIRGVSKVVIGVADQQRAMDFWVKTLGFTVTTDAAYGEDGERWIEVTAPDGNTVLILSLDREGRFKADGQQGRPNSNFFFYADDIERTYAELSKGVEFPAKPEKQPWGWWSMFTDSEGNRFALQQREG
ncbi:VOC family protein [Saccharomonospora sp. NPDC006951]